MLLTKFYRSLVCNDTVIKIKNQCDREMILPGTVMGGYPLPCSCYSVVPDLPPTITTQLTENLVVASKRSTIKNTKEGLISMSCNDCNKVQVIEDEIDQQCEFGNKSLSQQGIKKAIRYAETRRKSSTCRFADRVARLSVEHYRQHIPAKYRESLQATCVATILANESSSATTGSRLMVLAMGVGTKFLPESKLQNMCDNGDYPLDRVRDCHAEVLARRGFRRYLTEEIRIIHKTNDSDSHSDGILCKRNNGSSYQLKPGVTLHFYCSSSPCGNSVLKKFCKSRTEKFRDDLDECTWPTEPHPDFFGHSVPQGQCALLVKNDKTSASSFMMNEGDFTKMLRVQPSAKQVPWPIYSSTDWCPPGTTTVWSGKGSLHTCSDKIARWNTLGWQGSLLSSLLTNMMYIETMTVGRKLSVPMCQRAVCCRVQSQTQKHHNRLQSSPKLAVHHPAILATIVYLDETGVIDMETTKQAGADVQFHNPHCWVSWRQFDKTNSNQHVIECIDGSTGYRIVDTLDNNNNNNNTTVSSSISQVCTTALSQSFLELFIFQNRKRKLSLPLPQSIHLLSELRHFKQDIAPSYEQTKTMLTTKHPIFRDWRRREDDIVRPDDSYDHTEDS